MDIPRVSEQTGFMSDDLGLTWKLSFGAMVLAFSAVVTVVRTPPVITPVAAPSAAAVSPLPLLAAPIGDVPDMQEEAASASGGLRQAPMDAAEDAPVRIQVSLYEALPRRAVAQPHPAPRPQFKRGAPMANTKPATPPRSAAAPRAKRVLVAHAPAPHTIRGPHYPFTPRDRWRTGEQAFAPGR